VNVVHGRSQGHGTALGESQTHKVRHLRTSVERGSDMEEDAKFLQRERIKAKLDKVLIAQAMAVTVKAILTAVEAEHDDYWVNVDLNVHIHGGKALEKLARINVYGDRIDPYKTNIFPNMELSEVPTEILKAFCET
jgi:hypothetical protein